MAFKHNPSSLKTSIPFIVLLSLLHFQFSNAAVKGGYWFPGDLEASNIDSTQFTHLFCAFAKLDTQTNQITVPSECTTFPQTVKQKNPNVKALLSLGGGGGDDTSAAFKAMASQASSRQAFIDSSISQAISNNYDGLDLDWEQQSEIEEMNNLGTLLTEMRAAVAAKASSLILTAALHYSPKANSVATFPAQAISNNLDWVNVMAYDFYAPKWPPTPYTTIPHAALNDPSGNGVSGSSGIRAWIAAGVPANKLVLGFPYYGYKWELANPNDNGILAPAIPPPKDTSVDGTSYKEIKDFINQNNANVVYDSSYVTNYCYSGTTWYSYDDTQTISAKVAFVKENNLLGYFAWSIGQDDDWALTNQASQAWGA